jgi:phage tail-like protein
MNMPTKNQIRPACRFYVEVDGVSQAVFSEVSGLAMEVAVEDVEEGGNNNFVHKMPGRCKVGNVTLKRGLTNSKDFLEWTLKMANGTIQPKQVTVIMYNVNGQPAMKWIFRGAFPVKWTGPQFKADDSSAAIESIELAHDGFEIG